MAGIVFDALAKADFGQHLHIIVGALHDALRLNQFVVGALCAAVSSLITSSVLVQVIVFIVVTCGTLIATKPLVDKYKKGHKEVKTNSDRFIGQTGVMLTDIDTLETVGQVKVSGEVWTAKLKNPTPVKKDDKVKILAIEGVKMIVEPWQGE